MYVYFKLITPPTIILLLQLLLFCKNRSSHKILHIYCFHHWELCPIGRPISIFFPVERYCWVVVDVPFPGENTDISRRVTLIEHDFVPFFKEEDLKRKYSLHCLKKSNVWPIHGLRLYEFSQLRALSELSRYMVPFTFFLPCSVCSFHEPVT